MNPDGSELRAMECTDFVLIGCTSEPGVWSPPRSALHPSLLNPRRALLSTCMVSSNHSRIGTLVLVGKEQQEGEAGDSEAFAALMRKETLKESHRKARREKSLRAVLVYSWPASKPVLQTITSTSLPFYDDDTSASLQGDEAETASTKHDHPLREPVLQSDLGQRCAADLMMEEHANKFGTPVPGRRKSESGRHVAVEKGIPLSKAPREERTSSDSVMVELA